MTSESIFKAQLLKKLRKIPNSWWSCINQQSIHGTPDILGCVRGRFVAIECKMKITSAFKSHERLQMFVLSSIAQTNGIAIIATPKNADAHLFALHKLAS